MIASFRFVCRMHASEYATNDIMLLILIMATVIHNSNGHIHISRRINRVLSVCTHTRVVFLFFYLSFSTFYQSMLEHDLCGHIQSHYSKNVFVADVLILAMKSIPNMDRILMHLTANEQRIKQIKQYDFSKKKTRGRYIGLKCDKMSICRNRFESNLSERLALAIYAR